MPQSSAPDLIPLAVDLDGTLLRTDLLWEALAHRLRRNPLALIVILFWWARGRAYLKKKLGRRVSLNPATLPVNEKFLAWLQQQKFAGRNIFLATASDLQMAAPVADYFGIFDGVLASDGKTNLRAKNKLKALTEKFGDHGFDYAGNSPADLVVWSGARQAVLVNANPSVQKKAGAITKIAATFYEANSSRAVFTRFFDELFVCSGYLAAIIAGLLLAAAFPWTEFAGGAWIAPGLFIYAAQNKSGGDALRVGFAGGLSFWLASLYWLLLMPVAGFPILAWLALSAVMSLFVAVWVWTSRPAADPSRGSWPRRLVWSLAGASAWVALEMIRARVLGGFPWNFIGASQFRMLPLIQIASVTGVYGISFLVVWMSLSFYSAARAIVWRPALRWAWQADIFFPLLVIAVVFAWGQAKLNAPLSAASTLRVTLVQPDIPQSLIWDENANASRFRQLLALSQTALSNETDLLIWPESAVPQLDEKTYTAITNLIRVHRICLILNADDVVPRPNATNEYDNDVFNAAFLFDPEGRCPASSIYHKQRLVMFGEYIPLGRWLPFVKWFTPITGGFLPGNAAAQFDLKDDSVVTSPLICFEDMFPQVARTAAAGGADFLVNLTNDGWFGQSAEQWQHEVNAVFRAVENGVPLVRCCNNGISCWIDSRGRQREIFRDKSGSAYGAGSMTFDLQLHPHAPGFYTAHGDWFGWCCTGIAAVLAIFRAARAMRQQERRFNGVGGGASS